MLPVLPVLPVLPALRALPILPLLSTPPLPSPSWPYKVPQVGEAAVADSVHLTQFVDRAEAAALGAVVDDVLGEDGADAGQGVQLFRGGRVEGDGSRGRRTDARSAGPRDTTATPTRAASHTGARYRTRPRHRRRAADQDLFAVDEESGAVEPVGIGTRPHTARRPQRVGDPGTGRQPLDPRSAHLPADIDHDRGPGSRGHRPHPSARRPRLTTTGFAERSPRGPWTARIPWSPRNPRRARRSRPHHLGRTHRLGPPRPEVLSREHRRDDQHHAQRDHALPLDAAPHLQPQRQPLPHGRPDPLPPRTPRSGADSAANNGLAVSSAPATDTIPVDTDSATNPLVGNPLVRSRLIGNPLTRYRLIGTPPARYRLIGTPLVRNRLIGDTPACEVAIRPAPERIRITTDGRPPGAPDLTHPGHTDPDPGPPPGRSRRPMPQLPGLAGPFGEQCFRAQAELLRRGVTAVGPAPGLPSAVAGAPVGVRTPARTTGDCRCA